MTIITVTIFRINIIIIIIMAFGREENKFEDKNTTQFKLQIYMNRTNNRYLKVKLRKLLHFFRVTFPFATIHISIMSSCDALIFFPFCLFLHRIKWPYFDIGICYILWMVVDRFHLLLLFNDIHIHIVSNLYQIIRIEEKMANIVRSFRAKLEYEIQVKINRKSSSSMKFSILNEIWNHFQLRTLSIWL